MLYEGPSELNGEPIVAIVTAGSRNKKTGNMDQLWILPQAMVPSSAVKNGCDESVCGDCVLRGGNGCYVTTVKAPNRIWRAWRDGAYPRIAPDRIARTMVGRKIRLGAYGDPAAVPVNIVESLISRARGWTGYTHQWHRMQGETAERWQRICMASAEPQNAAVAVGRGWRVYGIRGTSPIPGLRPCPEPFAKALSPRPDDVQCEKCLGCSGNGGGIRNGGYWIAPHGTWKAKALAVVG